jgi:hypothetical protein
MKKEGLGKINNRVIGLEIFMVLAQDCTSVNISDH